ncbi:Putative Ribonuclease [[Torrubiella] hemipterigena]|uniref:Ribonuclease n=1 Tax=[Torrubiella] hemipterigena TaxID=1531966 RepID=A0A0A1T2R4_9HYPO|nr:Putative Ribonuclease [[Torrubiella] hemipterigena]
MSDSQPVDTVADDAMDIEPSTSSIFIPPSVHETELLSGASFSHYSDVPPSLLPSNPEDPSSATPCALGVDEAGRGPVLGPMVYGVFYLPLPLSDPLLRETHHFDDSKVLTAAVRSDLMEKLCTSDSDLYESCGWATTSLSARDIGANMLKPVGVYNLNAQAMDATIDLIKGVYAKGVNIQEIYVDTIGPPATYQAKLQRIFPTAKVTVAKKADSLYPCVSAASVCAKVTRDAALEVLYETRKDDADKTNNNKPGTMAWGSGYPSDARCVGWLRSNMHPVFGWGPECRFSWGTAKDMLDGKGAGVKVDWPVEEDEETSRVTDFFVSSDQSKNGSELGSWFGTPASTAAF